MKPKIFSNRYLILIIFVCAIAFAMIVKLFSLQIIQGEGYEKQAQTRLMRNVAVKAPRGDILDRYGRVLVTNREGFSIVLYKEYIKDEDINKLIIKIIHILEKHGESYIDTLPITANAPYEFYFDNSTGSVLKAKTDEFLKDKMIENAKNGKEALYKLKAYYKIEDGYTIDELRKIIGVRYEMESRTFNVSNPYTFATDISIDVVTEIRERHNEFNGVDILTEYIRQNSNGSLAAHILGRVGIIYKEEYDKLKDENYGMNDVIGKDGMEKYLEKYLKGKDGTSSIVQNIEGKTAGVLQNTDPIPGENVVLTLDKELQETLENSLGTTIQSINRTNSSLGASAGSAVVIDVHSGEVLAMASYPTFDTNTFNQNYEKMAKDPNMPMWNRAISGQYAPGSTFKMLTAIAALESNTISTTDTIYDEGVYKYYANVGYSPVCWIYADTGRTHGNQNVSQAIENSCNYYFYEVGRRMGIDTIDQYAKKFGLGEYTGIELTGESKGILASKEYKKSLNETWYPGDTLQAAIGQSYHLFTPIQLANYIATIANGGTRYKAHLLKSVNDGETLKEILKTEPEVADKIEMSKKNYDSVIYGMRKVSETGTASNVFSTFEIPVGGKTGTATVSKGTATALFVAFAPYDDPQIAIAIVVEHGGHGNYVAPIARDVIAKYMENNSKDDLFIPYNSLVK